MVLDTKVLIYSGCKILSVYWLCLMLSNTVNIGSFMFTGSEQVNSSIQDAKYFQFMLIGIIPSVTYLCLSIMLWVSANKISSLAVNSFSGSRPEEKVPHELILTTIFSAVGLVVALMAVPDLVSSVYSYHHLETMFRETDQARGLIGNMAGYGIQLFLGVVVMLGAKGLSGLVRWLRYAGQ